jgi:gamma-glutamyltranspeptidase/glutathione hydrolase
LAREGPRLLYGSVAHGQGDDRRDDRRDGRQDGRWGALLAADCATKGGHLRSADLAGYRVERREPLASAYRDAMLYLNPAPSLGGMLIHLTLDLLSRQRLEGVRFGSAAHRHLLATAMRLTQELRAETGADASGPHPALLARYRALMRDTTVFRRGTTQISIADTDGNLASMTLSNGEGAGYLLPGTGIMLNNMLGEEDLSPHGFHRWATDQRIGSMMCPTLVAHADGGWSVLGSSGSNRIRSAIVQVLHNLIDLRMPLDEAVAAARIHYEAGRLNLEPPCDRALIDALRQDWPDILAWSAPSVFFGGAHCVAIAADGSLSGAGDGRRGGVVQRV